MVRIFGSSCCIFLLWACVLAPVHAQSLSGNPLIQQGQLQYNAQEYQKAIAVFKRALASPNISYQDKTTALKYLGFIGVILRKDKDARNYFLQLLNLDPNFELGDLDPPKFVTAFQIVKKEYLAKRKVTITPLSPPEASTENPLEIRLRLVDHLKQTTKVVVFYRTEGAPTFAQTDAQEVKNPNWETTPSKDDAAAYRYFAAVVPPFRGRTQAYFTEYYAVVYNAKKATIATLGTDQSPERIKRTVESPKVLPPPPTPFYKTWWFWTIAGVVVVGGATAGILAAALPQGPPPLPTVGGAVVNVIVVK